MDTKKRIFNLSRNQDKRILLRSNSTASEKRLWQAIRGKQLGVKFRRQHGIGDYIVDFYCADKRLVVEIDGDSHFNNDSREKDHIRDNYFRSIGLNVVRYTNEQVTKQLDDLLQDLLQKLNN